MAWPPLFSIATVISASGVFAYEFCHTQNSYANTQRHLTHKKTCYNSFFLWRKLVRSYATNIFKKGVFYGGLYPVLGILQKLNIFTLKLHYRDTLLIEL